MARGALLLNDCMSSLYTSTGCTEIRNRIPVPAYSYPATAAKTTSPRCVCLSKAGSYILLFVLLFASVSLFAQNGESPLQQSYKRFLEEFHREMEGYEKETVDTSTPYILTNPEPLPDFMNDIPPSDHNTIYIAGISDPLMSPGEGREQALLRARMLAGIMKGCTVKLISDYYVSESSARDLGSVSGKYQDFYMIHTAFAYDSLEFNILRDTVNAFGETVMLVAFTKSPAPDTDTLVGSSSAHTLERIMDKHSEITLKSYLQCRNKMSCIPEPQSMQFISASFNKFFETSSEFNHKKIPPTPYTLKYKSNTDSIAPQDIPTTLRQGLWNAYFIGILKHIFLEARTLSGHLDALQDMHTSTTKTFTRESAINPLYIQLEKINVLNNRMSVNVSFINARNHEK